MRARYNINVKINKKSADKTEFFFKRGHSFRLLLFTLNIPIRIIKAIIMQFIIIASFPQPVKRFFVFFQKTAYIFAECRKIPARPAPFFAFFEKNRKSPCFLFRLMLI